MKRWVGLGVAVALLSLGAASAQADPGHDRPKITVFRFLQPPLKSDINESLRVVAHDPNSWISEIQVRWEKANGQGGVLFAHTYCIQDPDFSDPGTPAKLTIPVHFDSPGTYNVEVRAISERRCQSGNQDQTSRTLHKDVRVYNPLRSISDADDSMGTLDVSRIVQTQLSSETSATTEIIHRVRMFDPWDNTALAGDTYMEMYFDLDNDASRFERVLTIDLDETDSTLRAFMLEQSTGQGRGYAAVKRPGARTLDVRMPPLLLKKGLRNYRWYARVFEAGSLPCPLEDPCRDRVPDSGLMRHRL